MNGINQARVAPGPRVPRAGGGLAGTSRYDANIPSAQPMGPTQPPGVGMMGSLQRQPNYAQTTTAQTGVQPGQQMPSAVPQQAPLQFDPNDPRNAALAGYMNGA